MKQLPDSVLTYLLSFSWAVPSDIILRSCEAIVWSTHRFVGPVFDIGCGEGNIGEVVFWNQGQIDIGMDLDPEGIQRATGSSKYKKLIVGDARKIPLPSSSVKTVVSNSTFEHIEGSDTKAISEVSRVLKKNGLFFLTVPSDRYRDALKSYINSPEEFAWYNSRVMHYRYRTLGEWEKLLKKNKLKIISHYYYFSKMIIPIWYQLFKIAVFKIRGRELWSYIRDSRFSRFLPKALIVSLELVVLRPLINKSLDSDGTWHFIIAQKS